MIPRRTIGLLLLAVVIGLVAAITEFGLGSGLSRPAPITVTGVIGSEKASFLDDEQVKRVLRDTYGITVDYRKSGSISMVQESVGRDDFLWPSSQFARDLFEQSHGSTAKSEVIFNSPVAMYAWKPVADGLRGAGIVTVENGVNYLDLAKLTRVIEENQTWPQVGVPALSRKVLVYTTDPTKSNSGLLFSGLLATTFNNGELPDETTINPLLGRLQVFYGRLGFMQESSGYLFDQFLVSGMGAYPIIVGYENQIVEYGVQHPEARDLLNNQITIVYPRPSVWSAHTFIALTPGGERLLTALKDPAIQKLAWEQHGFRSGLLGVQNDPRAVQASGVATSSIETIPMPSAPVMERIIGALGSGATPTATP